MTREIKFRIYDKKRKEWVHDTEHAVNILGETIILGEILRRPDDTGIRLDELNDLEVMQYTGLKDWHGKEVFEGDIVRFTYNERTAIIEFSDEVVENMWDMRDHSWNDKSDYDDIEVIGNIHENPELL